MTRICIKENCYKHSSFNYKNKKSPIYCLKHKKDNMINIISKKCIEKNCDIQSTFNYENEKIAF